MKDGKASEFLNEFFLHVGERGWNTLYLSRALVKRIGKEGAMPHIFWRLIFCLFPSHRHRHHSCLIPFFLPVSPSILRAERPCSYVGFPGGSWFCIIALSAGPGHFLESTYLYVVMLYIHGKRRRLSWFQRILFITGGLLDDSL